MSRSHHLRKSCLARNATLMVVGNLQNFEALRIDRPCDAESFEVVPNRLCTRL